MKKIFTLLLVLVSAGNYLFAQNTGGPDAYGYTWKNNLAAGGPTYQWVEIITNNKGTQVLGLDDDNAVGFINMGFSMKYYWVDVNRIKIGSNGWVSFNDINNIAHGFPSIPQTDGYANFVAPFMADLNFSTAHGANPGKVYYWTNPAADTMVVTYSNVPFWISPVGTAPDFTGSNTFQVIFSKADNGITYQYKTMETTIPNLTTFNDVVVGIENITQAIGLEVMKDVIPVSASAYKFYRPTSSTFQITDLKTNWSLNNKNGAVIALKNQPMIISGNLGNVGNTNVSNSFTVNTTIRNKPTGPIRFNQTVTLPKLRQGLDTTYSYGVPFVPAQEGAFGLDATVSLTGDANATNNLTSTEILVIDTTGRRELALQYYDAQPEGVSGFGAAVYFKPPFYPTQVRSVDAFILGAQGATVSTNTFNVRVYAEAANGGLGMLLFDTTLVKANIILNALNTIEIPNKKLGKITSGGFFVAWVPIDVVNSYVAVDRTAPFSFRNYEVQTGQITEYRSNDIEDFAISANIGTKILGPLSVKKDILSNNTFALFPNPTQDNVKVSFELKENVASELTISNIIGSKVKTISFGKQLKIDQNINTADLNAGIYLVTLKAGDATVTKRLVVTK